MGGSKMNLTHATDAAKSAKNTSREDWVSGAAKLIVSDQASYDRSQPFKPEPYICRDNIVSDIDVMPLINKWLDGVECCDCRDELSELIFDKACEQLRIMADDFEIGEI